MEKVSLRVYSREIEGLVEGGQLDEAVAHCQHILKTFPMHVETYRLLGKAFLEARRYADAGDIFQRVLMAVPDDFVSHVGMSIIRDDGNKLDEAIWHMERAFEVQPSNSAIQGELRRLYGRRDGVEPSKIRLSRDALANMYSQGELFNQAIAEIRSVLAEDPNRPDLQVMLMRAYFRSGQKVEAAEIAATLLKKYPYSLDSLRVLVDVLPGTARAENMQVYRHRLFLLDPYSSHTKDTVFSSDQVADSAVTLERLDYRPGAMPGSPQPDWASSLGIKLNTDKQAEPAPEWMQNPESTEKPSEAFSGSTGLEAEPATAETIPEWMRSSGWQASTAENKEVPTAAGEVPPNEPITKAEIPDWLMSMAPSEGKEPATSEAEEPALALPAGEDGIPDWLKPVAPAEKSGDVKITSQESVGSSFESGMIPTVSGEAASDNSIKATSSVEPRSGNEDIPDWLKPKNLSEPVSEPNMESLAPAEPQAKGAEDNTPDWLKSMNSAEPVEEPKIEPQIPVEPQAAGVDDMPDWLKSMTPAGPVEETKNEPQTPVEPQPTSAEDMPDWLKSMAPSGAVGETKNETQLPVESQPANIESVPDLSKAKDSAEGTGDKFAKPAELMTPQVAGSEDVPDWFKTMTPAEAAGDMIPGVGKLVEPQQASDEDVPDWLKSLQPKQTTDLSKMASESPRSEIPTMESEPEPTPAEPVSTGAEAFPDWLKDLGAGETAPSFGVSSVQPADSAQAIPDLPAPVEPADQAPVTPQLSENSQVEESFQASGEVKPLNIGDDALGWLESLAAKQGAKPEELLTNPQDRKAEMPDWLREPDQKPDESPVVPPQQPVRSPRETLPLEPLNSFINASKPTTSQFFDEVLPVQKEPSESSLEPVAKSADHPVSSEEDTMAWLERLSGDQKEPTEGSSINSEEIQKTISEENQPVLAGQPVVPAPEELVTKPLEPVDGEDITITSWLNKLDVEEALNNAPTEQPGEQPPAAPAEALPDWLKDLENSKKAVVNPKPEADLPEWLRHPISPVEPELSSPPEVPSWVDENASVTGQAVPTTPEEWVPAESKPEPGLEPSTIPESTLVNDNQPVAEPVLTSEIGSISESQPTAMTEPAAETASVTVQPLKTSPTLKQTGMLSPVPVKDKDAELLSTAQTVLNHDSLDESMKYYMKLIKKGHLLDEVIHDLREATYRYPVDVIIWQTLGDAYMRANRLQDALDAYTKAEELLR